MKAPYTTKKAQADIREAAQMLRAAQSRLRSTRMRLERLPGYRPKNGPYTLSRWLAVGCILSVQDLGREIQALEEEASATYPA